MKSFKVIFLCVATLLFNQCNNSGGSAQNQNTSDQTNTESQPKKKFTVAWSIYAGWMPWDYAGYSGILKKWADKYNIEIELVKMDYIPSIEAYIAGKVDACVMTNMEGLDMPAASGITSTALILGDYSNGNDAILTRDNLQVKNLSGKEIYLVELSVSHYLLSRALEQNGLKESNVKIVNTSDSDIAPAFLSNNEQKAVVTWNPMVMNLQQNKGIKSVFTSASIPEEILDLMVVKTKTLEESPELGKVLTGAWYEVMNIMTSNTEETEKAMKIMAESAGSSVDDYKAQLKTTAMFYHPAEAVDYVKSNSIVDKMDYVRKFCFAHGLFGENAKSIDDIGIKYPNGTIQGNSSNVQLIFDATYMEQASQSAL